LFNNAVILRLNSKDIKTFFISINNIFLYYNYLYRKHVFLLVQIISRNISLFQTNNRLSIYYESICPDSRRFVLNQLVPAYDKLSKYLDIDLVPFGNANVSYPNHDFKPYFQCQHGPNECYGNKAHACVIDMTKSTRPTLNYIKCMFEADNWKQTMVTAEKVIHFINTSNYLSNLSLSSLHIID